MLPTPCLPSILVFKRTRHHGFNYYTTSCEVVRDPGYLRTDTIVRLETNLYESRTGRLVWSRRSNTFDPKSVADTIESVTRVVAERLAEEGLIGG